MDDGLRKMIADLENLGSVDTSENCSGDDVSLESVFTAISRIGPPETIFKRVKDRIDHAQPRVRTDASGRVTEINPAFTLLCGYSFQEIQGRTPGSMLQGPDSEQESIEVLRNAIRSGCKCVTEIFNYHKDGSRYRVRISVTPLRDDAGRLVGFEATEQKLS